MIALDWVLTAKHCVVRNWEKRDFRPNPDTVWAGIANLKNKRRAAIRNVPVSSITLHDSAGKKGAKQLVIHYSYL